MKNFATRLLSLATLFAGLACSTAALAQNRVVYTDPAITDGDFLLQGEYYGATNYDIAMGLQVVANGEGQLTGRLFQGGLPGGGWYGGGSEELKGERDGGVATLVGDRYVVDLRYAWASIYHRGGSYVGALHKVERKSTSLGLPAPPGSIVLFDFENPSTEKLASGKLNRDGYLAAGALTAMPVEDFRLHVEFRTPFMPNSKGQARGNSGVYIQQRYEVQILDSFGQLPQFNEAASLYRTEPPLINMSFPPLVWQTYDIEFQAARWQDGQKVRDAQISVLHNGYPVHVNYQLPNKTGAGRPEGPDPRPIMFQDHRDPVVFRNIWLLPLNRQTLDSIQRMPYNRMFPGSQFGYQASYGRLICP